jgi:hypothetical protein
MARSPVAIDDIAMLTMLLPTRIVTSSRWGSSLRSCSVSAPRSPSVTIESTRWGGSENIAISDEEKKADRPSNSRIVAPPTTAMTRSPAGTPAVPPPTWAIAADPNHAREPIWTCGLLLARD